MSEIAKLRAFVLWFISEPKQELGAPASFVERRRHFVRGTWRPHLLWRSFLVEPGAKVTMIVFTEETWWPSSNTLSECYNNVDVGVPL